MLPRAVFSQTIKFVCISTVGSNVSFNHLSANPSKWSNTLEQFVVADELFECA